VNAPEQPQQAANDAADDPVDRTFADTALADPDAAARMLRALGVEPDVVIAALD